MLPMYPTVKSTHLHSLTGNFIIWQVSTPLPAPGRPLGSTGPQISGDRHSDLRRPLASGFQAKGDVLLNGKSRTKVLV